MANPLIRAWDKVFEIAGASGTAVRPFVKTPTPDDVINDTRSVLGSTQSNQQQLQQSYNPGQNKSAIDMWKNDELDDETLNKAGIPRYNEWKQKQSVKSTVQSGAWEKLEADFNRVLNYGNDMVESAKTFNQKTPDEQDALTGQMIGDTMGIISNYPGVKPAMGALDALGKVSSWYFDNMAKPIWTHLVMPFAISN